MQKSDVGGAVDETINRGVSVSDELLEMAERKGYDRRLFEDEIKSAVKRTLQAGSRLDHASLRLLYAWLLGQTAALVIFIIIIWPSKMPSVLGLGADAHLLVLAIAAGFLGSSLASLAEVLDDPRGVTKNELPLIVALPVFGAGIALIFYIALRGGILSITISDAAAVEVINPYGLAAFSGIVGLFVNKAVFKLGVVSDALFGITESERRARGIMESEGRAEGTGEKGSK